MAGQTQYLNAKGAAAYLVLSPRSLHELTRTKAVPHRRFPNRRSYLFSPEDLDAYVAGAPLETVALPDGGLIVRPKVRAA